MVPAEIAAVLERGGQVVTANARAARALLRAYAERARAQGMRSWKAPAIQAWGEWVGAQYEALSARYELPTLLSDLQEVALWKRVQREDALRVVAPHQLAKLAQEAYALLHGYGAAASAAAFGDAHEDAERFLGWATTFDRECARLGVVSRARCEALLARHEHARAYAEMLLVGFDRLSPAQRAVVAAMERAGVRCVLHEPADAAAAPRVVAAADAQQELEACGLWVRAQLAGDAARRVGVLAPQLGAVRAEIDRVFRRVLLPESSQRTAGGSVPYEFSLGVPLARMPNVAAALSLLRWLAGPLDAAEVSGLLLGDFLAADAVEARQLAAADEMLRRRGQLRAEMPLPALLRDAGAALPETVRSGLRSAQELLQMQGRRERTWPEWADTAVEALRRAGWPGYRERGTILFQAEEAWRRLLEEVSRLGALGGRVGWGACVETLRESAEDRLFAAETMDAPVQVMGLAEAAGQTFDAVWVLGMTEERWPGRGRMHPLLPPGLQRAHGMPHADRDADSRLAEAQMRRVAGSAPAVTWSYACAAERGAESGAEQRPSPMLRALDPGYFAEPAERLAAPRGVPLLRVPEQLRGAPWPLERVAGGSEVLRYQSACGFQSFARVRLRAAALEDEAWGLDLRDRAVLLHRALERLWSTEPVPEGAPRLHTLDDLLAALADDQLTAYVADAVAYALRAEMARAGGDGWDARFLELEARRLTGRVLGWLEIEHQRAAFRVTALEQKVDAAQIGELRLRLRLDRADTLEDGTTLLLDYKTSDAVSVQQWRGERPDEPQLPIYALFGGLPRVAAVAFAQVRAGKTCMHALAEEPEQQLGARFATPPGKEPRHVLTAEMRAEWDAALRGLAQAFLQGEAPVNPKKGATTCARCGLFALCRVRSQRDGLLAEDDENADA